MPSAAFAGVGTLFQRENSAGGGTYSTVAEVNSISGPSMSREIIDVTSLSSTGGYREFITGFRDGGEVTLELNFTITQFNLFKTDFERNASWNYRIVMSDTGATTLNFAGFVTSIPPNIMPDDKVTLTVTIKVTGVLDLDT